MDDQNILEVRGLQTYFKLDEGILKAVDGVDFSLRTGKTPWAYWGIRLRQKRYRPFDS